MQIEKIKSITVAVMMVVSLGLISSCQRDSLQGDTGAQDSDECTINLSVSDSEDQIITSRSASSAAETFVDDLYLLCFDTTGIFRKGEVFEINGNLGSPMKITTKIVTGTQGIVVALANSRKFTGELGTKTNRLNDEMSGKTIDDLNVVFMNTWDNFKLVAVEDGNLAGKFMPMSSTQKYIIRPTTDINIELIHSFAKLKVSYKIKAGDDITGLFGSENIGKHKYSVLHYLKEGFNNIYRDPLSPISITSHEKENFMDSPELFINGNADEPSYKKIIYLPEYPNSVLAKGSSVDPLKWHKDRMSILLKASDGGVMPQWFRLDFYQKGTDGTYKFLDIERNKNITFIVTAVRGKGYATREEAIAAPASNIEYTIDVSEKNQIVNSNGQYAISMSNDGAIIKGGAGTYNVATVSYQAPEGVDLSSLEAMSSVTANILPGVSNADILFNGKLIPQIGNTPLKFESGPNIIQLVTNPDTKTVDCQVYLSFGNIKDTIVVKYYPYSDKKVELKLAGSGVPNMMWEKNEAKVTASKTMLTVPYAVRGVDARSQGVVYGKFRVYSTTHEGDVPSFPVTTHLKVDVLQKGIDGILTRFLTDINNGQLQFGEAVEINLSPIKGVEKVLLPTERIVVTAKNYTADGQYYKAKGWTKPDGNEATVNILPDGSGYELTVPYKLNNAGKYIAHFEEPVPAQVTLTFNANGYAANDMPSDITGHIGDRVPISIIMPTLNTYKFLCWTSNQDGTGKEYIPGYTYTLKENGNVLYAKWEKQANIQIRTIEARISFMPGASTSKLNVDVQYDDNDPDRKFSITIHHVNKPTRVRLMQNGGYLLHEEPNGGFFASRDIKEAHYIETLP